MKNFFYLIATLLFTLSLSIVVNAASISKTKAYTIPKQKFTLKVSNTKSKKIKWTSSNTKTATVTNGKIKAIKKGHTTIIAQIGKKKYKCNVIVLPKKKMANKLYSIVDYFSEFYSESFDTEDYDSVVDAIKITKKKQTKYGDFIISLSGKIFNQYKRDYKKAIRILKIMNKHLRLIKDEVNSEDEYGFHTDEYYDLDNDIWDDLLDWWDARMNLQMDVWKVES